jgi:hypothetical protein
MKNVSKISSYIAAYLGWIFFILLFLVVILLGRDTLLAFLRNYWAQERFDRQFAINFIDRSFVLTLGIAWLIFMIILESYFRTGIVKGILTHRLSKVFGFMIMTIFVIHFLRSLMSGVFTQPGIQWVLLATELAIGAGLLFLSQKTTKIIKVEKIE